MSAIESGEPSPRTDFESFMYLSAQAIRLLKAENKKMCQARDKRDKARAVHALNKDEINAGRRQRRKRKKGERRGRWKAKREGR